MKKETMSKWDEKDKRAAVQSGKGPGEFGSKFILGGYKKPKHDPILAHKINKKHKRNKKINKDTLNATWYIIYVIIFLLVVLLWVNE